MAEISRKRRFVLGVESSCDETGVALFDLNCGKVVAEALHSQIALHAPYGGVVPELASRDHIKYGLRLIDQVLREAECTGLGCKRLLPRLAQCIGRLAIPDQSGAGHI